MTSVRSITNAVSYPRFEASYTEDMVLRSRDASNMLVWFFPCLLRWNANVKYFMNQAQDRLASHYGQNDAREVRRRERSEDVDSTLPFNSLLDKVAWYFVTSASFGAPLRYLKRINNVVCTN
jgi:hypothetical protein